MGAPKADLVVAGRSLLARAVDVLLDGGCDRVLAVVRPDTATVPDSSEQVVNPDPDEGQRRSLFVALDAATALGADAMLVTLVDQPGVDAAAVGNAARAWAPGRVVITEWADGRAHPVVMSCRRWRDAIALAAPDEGARRYLAANPELVWPVSAPGRPGDLDRPTDVAAWEAGR